MSQNNSSYKKLFSNTLIIALGSFSSKILMILLNFIYTRYLTQEELGVNENIQQISNWLIPLFTLEIFEAVIRFGLDKRTDNKKVFTTGNAVCLGGLALLFIIMPVVDWTGAFSAYLNGYAMLICVYILAASLQMVYSYFLRALEKMRLFSISVIFNTAATLLGTVLFIMVLKLGNRGYLYSIIAGNLLTVLFMFIAGGLGDYLRPRHFDKPLLKKMLKYSIPLIPAQLMWLVTNSSDTFMTTHYLGNASTGILSQSYKIANVVSTVYLMFGQAWNMSAVMEDDSEDRDEFYGNVFHLNQCLMYILVAGCLMICRPLTLIWMGENLLVSATYSPILIYSTIFMSFTTFMGSVYLASGRTGRSLLTSVIAGAVNITLNLYLIPRFGLIGPPITTVVSYLTVFIVRVFDSRSIVPFRIDVPKLIINNLILIAMTLVSVLLNLNDTVMKAAYLLLPLMFIIVTALNIKPVWSAVMNLAPPKIRSIAERLGTVKLIAIGIAAAAFAVVCFLFRKVLIASCLLIFSAAAAYGMVREKRLIKLGGMAGIFAAVWAVWGIYCAFFALLVLSAAEYLRSSDTAAVFIGAVSLAGVLAGIGGIMLGIFSADIMVFIALIVCMKKVTGAMERLLISIEERRKARRSGNGK